MVANAQLMLAQQQDPTAGIELKDCYLFGTSTANQRIESWWGQLSKGQLIKWRVCNHDIYDALILTFDRSILKS